MPEVRTPREAETREKAVRAQTWAPPVLLPDPTPEEGYVFRWIRLSTLGAPDPMNISSKTREGWEPVKASMHPEVALMGTSGNRFTDSIEVGGLLLCKMPSEMAKQRDEYYANQAKQQMTSVDNNLMRENDPRMPLFNQRRSEVTFGKGNS